MDCDEHAFVVALLIRLVLNQYRSEIHNITSGKQEGHANTV